MDCNHISNADVVLLETDIPPELNGKLSGFLSDVKPGARLLSYMDLRSLWVSSSVSERSPFRQMAINATNADRYETSWSVHRGHHFFLFQRMDNEELAYVGTDGDEALSQEVNTVDTPDSNQDGNDTARTPAKDDTGKAASTTKENSDSPGMKSVSRVPLVRSIFRKSPLPKLRKQLPFSTESDASSASSFSDVSTLTHIPAIEVQDTVVPPLASPIIAEEVDCDRCFRIMGARSAPISHPTRRHLPTPALPSDASQLADLDTRPRFEEESQ